MYIFPYLRTCARGIPHERRRTDIRKSCSPHPLIVDCLLAPPTYFLVINPRRACARVTVLVNPRRACARVTVLVLSVCLSVCLCVCFPYSGTSRNHAYKQQYQRLQRDTGMKYKKGFFFKTLRSEVMASFTHLE